MKKSLLLILCGIGIILLLTILLCFFLSNKKELPGLFNPWLDCGLDFNKAEEVAGFSFNVDMNHFKYNVRAMKGIIEIQYDLDDDRTLIIRKSISLKSNDIKLELSGVYDNYPIEKVIALSNEQSIKIEMDTNNKIYLAYFFDSTGYYSLYCKEGMSLEEIEHIYKNIKEPDSKKEKKIDYSNCELGDLVGKDVERIYIQGFYIDYHSNDYTELEAKKIAQSCLDENVSTQYEMDCCLRYKMFPDTF